MNNPLTTSTDITYPVQMALREWDKRVTTVIGKLQLADALLARISVGDWETRRERLEWVKNQIGPLVREADPKDVLNDPNLVGMVRQLWGERAVLKLRDKVASCATPNAGTPTTPK